MRNDERGIALVITLFLMASLSALAVSLMFLSQTETASSRNYRTMSQARYAGEAGVHKTLNYLMTSYTPPSSFTGFGTGKSPVTCTAGCTVNTPGTCDASTPARAVATGCIVLSSLSGVASNYPNATVAAAFASATNGSLPVNGTGSGSGPAVSYKAAAILMAMRAVSSYGGASGVVQTWQIVAEGTSGQAATVEVTASLEREIADAQTFAIFATGTGCGAINLGGNVQTASYDSSVGTAVSNYGGNVGTNGNLTIGGHVDVHGSLSSPRTGVGKCTEGANVTALTQSGAATVDNNALTQLPQALHFETPEVPATLPPTSTTNNCATVVLVIPATCATSGGKIVIDPMGTTVRLGNITSGQFVLKGGNYIINSITGASGTKMQIGTSLLGSSQVVIDLVGKTSSGGDMATVYDTTGNGFTNPSMDPSKLQIRYAGTGAIEMTGAADAAFMLYAPNASVTTHGNADIYGSILARQVTSSGTPRFIYDRHLQSTFKTLGNYVMTSFSWKKY